MALVGAMALAPAHDAQAQGATVTGRLTEDASGVVVSNALVELVGHGATLSNDAGLFRFFGVAEGSHRLRVDGFGYAAAERTLEVSGDEVTVAIRLSIAPIEVDSLVVVSRTTEIRGRVRDPVHDMVVVDAEVLTTRVGGVATDAHGRFEVEDVPVGAPIRMWIRAAGYLPIDTVLTAEEDADRHVFELTADSVALRMMARQLVRLDDRARPRRAATMRPMDRDAILRYAGHSTVRDMLEAEYYRKLARVNCVLVDEVLVLHAERVAVLQQLLPEQLSRLEFLFGGAMLRVYTRDFVSHMAATGLELRDPFYDTNARPPICH